jgi:hypothetical protein
MANESEHMKRKTLISGVVLLLAWFTPASFAASVRLAIIPEAQATRKLADVLTATLSSGDAVQLVERAELERVLAEQGIGSGANNFLALGQTLRADGVLLLSLSRAGTNQLLTLHLMAVQLRGSVPSIYTNAAAR